MNLRALLASYTPLSVEGSLERSIDSIVSDSREARNGAMFVAIRGGQEQDRHAFVEDAVKRGAAAILVEEESVDAGASTKIVVDDTRRALALLASRFHGNPSQALLCVGVTGTNGKSTTATIIQQILSATGESSAYLGTLGFLCGGKVEPVANTTPEAGQLQALLARAHSAGCRSMVMEASSHGLALDRLHGIDFDAAVFTNLTRDHLDFHGSEEEYFSAKSLLFRQLQPSASAILNVDDPRTPALAQLTGARVWTYGSTSADVALRKASLESNRTHLELDTPHGVFAVDSSLTGRFNCSNVVAAVTAGFALGIGTDVIRDGIAAVPSIPGRFERIDEGQPFQVIVDYAHTPAGLETVLHAARELAARQLICVFGCGGDRDTGKRSMMGRIAEELADRVYLTSDNPRSEPPLQIIEQIVAGMQTSAAVVEPDRSTAIHTALSSAGAGDVVVIAGKGDEPYQILDSERVVAFDDRVIARQALASPAVLD
jgi:UDP-N-acetylmuramoyl-L-alanyl-D-glutamate--2,6-diaminopimelate ligase